MSYLLLPFLGGSDGRGWRLLVLVGEGGFGGVFRQAFDPNKLVRVLRLSEKGGLDVAREEGFSEPRIAVERSVRLP